MWVLCHLFCMQNRLFDEGIEVPIKAIEGKLYVRISAHVHNEVSDYHQLRDCVLDL
jgi:isopenicillin-N epimerase